MKFSTICGIVLFAGAGIFAGYRFLSGDFGSQAEKDMYMHGAPLAFLLCILVVWFGREHEF